MTAGGQVTIADRVVERIATHAVADVPEVGGAARRVWGVMVGTSRPEAAPRAAAHVDGRLTTLTLTMSVSYPSPVRKVAGKVRDIVSSRVSELTGLEVRQVDVEVARLIGGPAPRRVT